IASGGDYDIEYRVIRPQGEQCWVSAKGRAQYDAAGQVLGMIGVVQDVTEQVLARQRSEDLLKQLEAERAFLEAVLQQMPAGVIIGEAPSGKLILGNDRVREIWRHPFVASTQVEQYREYKGFHPDGRLYQPQEWPIARSIGSGEVVSGEEIQFLRGDGTYGVMEISSAPIRDREGQIIAGVVTFQDISDRKQAEREREELLAREQAARTEAETANRIKDEFLAVLSHELRSPLNPILGWTNLLRTRKLDEKTTTKALETIERNAKLQTQLIEDLLDVSRILRGKVVLDFAPVNLANIIEAALETVLLAAEAKKIQIQTIFSAKQALISGDSGRLQQIVWNLLSNAVKFTPAGGTIEVRLECVDCYAQIQVKDNGMGISPDFLPHVFEYFRQADGTTTRKFGGLGLGLAIVRHLAELHGGTVRASSLGISQGATFTVTLPLLVTAFEATQNYQASTEIGSLSGLRILIVDDEPDMRELGVTVLAEYGSLAKAAASAAEALFLLKEFQPDILICDIGMPEVDGYMLMRQVRSRLPEMGGQIPAIALTAYAGEYDRQQAISAGFNRHLPKPVDPAELIKTILSLTAEKQRSRGAEGKKNNP
ncbi:ATP-binding protein, partial [Planktothrix sp. FACHB-1355]